MEQLQDIVAEKKRTESEWQELIASDLVVKIHSKILNDDVWIVSNPKHKWRVEDDSPIYLIKEIKLLYGSGKDALLKIHQVKTTFEGEVIDDDELDASSPSVIIESQMERKQREVKSRLQYLVEKHKILKKEKVKNEQHQTQLFKNG